MFRVREVVDLASDAAFAINRHCHVAAWNKRAEQMLGYRQDEVLGRPCSNILQAVLPGGEPLCAPRCARRCDLPAPVSRRQLGVYK
jgi:PAS domain-containing protein